MSLARATLVIVQALTNHWACTPPNPTQQKSRYHTEELYILQIAPLVFKLFTFDLTVHPEHRLVTSSFYAYVRHPAYTGSMLLVAGIAFSHLTEGSWLTECGPLKSNGSALVVWAAWWVWTLAVGVSRAEAEDKQMQKMFPGEWERYAENVAWWFFPGLA
ncbi:hypothetical protein HHX47_DHR4000930 [Lentinula edodes]|nr:hypothetical protein HHX47_DHR4000930 [Lentinula edodes]